VPIDLQAIVKRAIPEDLRSANRKRAACWPPTPALRSSSSGPLVGAHRYSTRSGSVSAVFSKRHRHCSFGVVGGAGVVYATSWECRAPGRDRRGGSAAVRPTPRRHAGRSPGVRGEGACRHLARSTSFITAVHSAARAFSTMVVRTVAHYYDTGSRRRRQPPARRGSPPAPSRSWEPAQKKGDDRPRSHASPPAWRSAPSCPPFPDKANAARHGVACPQD